jgi:hypothetical protein
MAIKKSETPAKTAGKLVKGAVKGWINKGMADTLKGVNAAAGGGLLGKVAAVAQAPNIVGVSAMAQSGYKTRKASGATPGGKKPLFSRDYPLSESPNPEFKNQK